MDVREEFVLRARQGDCNLSDLCRQYGISRKTGYKWLERFELGGWAALESQSRRPDRSPLQTSAEAVAEIVAIRRAHRGWGARKILAALEQTMGDKAPSLRTVARVLVRTGFVQQSKRRREPSRPDVGRPRVHPVKPNDLWTVDFKGWWRTRNGERCEPLTLRDAFSRYVLAVDVLSSPKMSETRAIFERVFGEFGLPDAILSDCGVPFVAPRSQLGLTSLSAWWLGLGIEHYRARPGTPSDNGGHERMHRDMADELEAFSALTRKSQQLACDRWRHEFNHHRPHEALSMKKPADVYHRSAVHFDSEKTIEPSYPEQFHVRTVRSTGALKIQKTEIYISSALAEYPVGLEYLERGHYALWFAHRRLGEIDIAARAFSADEWNAVTTEEETLATQVA